MFKIAPPWSLHRGAFVTCRPLGGACPVGAAQRAHPPRRPSGAAPSCPLMMGYGSRGTCSGGKAGSPPRPPERGARPPRRGAEAEAGQCRQVGGGKAGRQSRGAQADGQCSRKNIRGHSVRARAQKYSGTSDQREAPRKSAREKKTVRFSGPWFSPMAGWVSGRGSDARTP